MSKGQKRSRRGRNNQDGWRLEKDDRTTGFRLWRKIMPGVWPQGDVVTVSGVPGMRFPDGTTTKSEWDVFVGDDEYRPSRTSFSSPADAMRFAEEGPDDSVAPNEALRERLKNALSR